MEAMLTFEEHLSFEGDEATRTSALLTDFRAAFPSVDRGARIAFMMRFGWAPPPTARVGRRPLTDSVEELAAASTPPAPPEGDDELRHHAGPSLTEDDPTVGT
jgi:hypothetical protein